MDQDPLACHERPCVVQALPGGHRSDRHGSGMHVVQAIGSACEFGLVYRNELGKRAERAHGAHDPIADLKARGTGPDGLDHTGQFGAQHGRQGQRKDLPHQACADFPVDAVDAGGADAHQHLAGSGVGHCNGCHFGGIGAAVSPDHDCALGGAHDSCSSGVAMNKLYGVAQVIRRRQSIDAWFQIWNTMDLNALIDFALVAANQGLGKASRASGRSKATLSRRIAELEEQLGVRLVERSARGLRLTEAGQLLMERTEVPLSEVAEAMAAAREGLSTPRGRLRVASPVLFSQLAMGRIGAEFCAAYPEITLEVVAEDRTVDLVEEQFDVAIRINPSPDSSLVGRCFAKDRLVVVAAPSIAMPTSSAVAPIAAVVTSSFQPTTWALDDGRLVLEPIPRLRFSSFLMVRDAALAGGGVALIPQSIAWNQLARGELVQWGTISGVEPALWVLHTSRRLAAPKVRAFVDFICDRYPDVSLVLKG